MKKIFKKTKLKIFSAACSALLALPMFCTPAHAAYNRLMATLYTVPYPTVEGIQRIVESNPKLVKGTDNETGCDKTVIYYALTQGTNTMKNRVAIAKYLITKGAPMECMACTLTLRVCHPYVWACENGQYEFASWLIRQPGYDYDWRSELNNTVVDWAIEYNRKADLEYLKKAAPHIIREMKEKERKEKIKEQQEEKEKNARKMASAIRYGNISEVKNLIRYVNLNSPLNEKGELPLQLAVKSGKSEIITLLVSNGANLYATDSNGRTLLHLAVIWNQVDIVKNLIDRRVPINPLDKNGFTPLDHCACHTDRKSVV